MDDIQRLKRISAMSAELRKHRIAADSEEAFKQSEAIFQEATPKHLQVNQDLSVGDVQEKKSEVLEVSAPHAADYERFKNGVNTRLLSVEENMSSVIGKLNEMIKTINKLEQRFEQNGVAELPKERQETISKPEKKESEGQLRSGDYKPGDVRIDNIFYYGKK